MFSNLYPGGGLGFTGSKELAFGLAPVVASSIVIPLLDYSYGGGGSSGYAFTVYDNGYSVSDDDNEITEVLSILLGVIE